MRWTRISALGLTASLALLAAACGSTPAPHASPSNGQPGSSTTAGPTTTVGPAAQIAPVSMPTTAGTFGTAPPPITVPTGAPPTELESSDLITGTGATAEKGDTVTVQYVLVNYATEQELQSSWTSQPFSFTLDANPEMVIKGWDEGVAGMKVGGRRELIIPPNLAYDSSPPAGIPSDATLVFVIDLLKVAT